MQEVERVQGVSTEETAAGEDVQVPTDEWTAAALAHASILLNLIFGTAGGVGVLIGPVVPLAIFLGYRERSRFVAFQALQAFAYQAIGVVILILLSILAAAAWAASSSLMAAFVGLLLVPPALSITLLVACAFLTWLGYGLYAAYQVYQGRDLRYWLVGEWLERRESL